MKLNLLPTSVSKGKQGRTATVISILFVLFGVVLAVFLIKSSNDAVARSEEHKSDWETAYQKTVQNSAKADKIIADASVLIKDATLATAMLKHNEVYPVEYADMRRWIPPFYRIRSMVASPIDGETYNMQLIGYLKSYQQYADLTLALMANPKAISVQRQGYVDRNMYIPAVNPLDQTGRPIKPGQTPIPDDPLARLQWYQSQASGESYVGTGNFGSDPKTTRTAMPDESEVTISMVMKGNLQVPNPSQTLSGIESKGTGAGGGGGANIPANFGGGPPPGIGGPPTGGGGPGGPGGGPPARPNKQTLTPRGAG